MHYAGVQFYQMETQSITVAHKQYLYVHVPSHTHAHQHKQTHTRIVIHKRHANSCVTFAKIIKSYGISFDDVQFH